MGVSQDEYLLAGQPSELERLQLQSRGSGSPPDGSFSRGSKSRPDGRALDLGCGALGWLRILSEWVGPSGEVAGAAGIDERLLEAAGSFLEAEGISNVELVIDDILDSKLEPQGFHLVHARYLIAPLRQR